MATPAPAPLLQVKGPKPFTPFAGLTSEQALIHVWQAFAKAAPFLEQGKRLENLSWRLWSLQARSGDEHADEVAVLNRGRVAAHVLNRDKGTPVLLPPSGRSRAKCCKIDPSVPCVHKTRSTSRPVLAAGPSVPLRTASYNSAESSHHGSTTAGPIATSSRITLDTDTGAQAQAQTQGQATAKPAQPLWPISSISPNAHLAPSPFFGGAAQGSANGGLGGNVGSHGVSPAAQIMFSALIESLLSAGVAPSVALQTAQQHPSHLMASPAAEQAYTAFGAGPTTSLPGTVPSTPMDWSNSAAGSLPPAFDESARGSMADMFGPQQQQQQPSLGPAFDLANAALRLGTPLDSQARREGQTSTSDWLHAFQMGSTSALNQGQAGLGLGLHQGAASPAQMGSQRVAGPSSTGSWSGPDRRGSLLGQRRVGHLRHQQKRMSISTSSSAAASPTSDQASLFGAKESASFDDAMAAMKSGKKGQGSGDAASPVGAGPSGKGKGKASSSTPSLVAETSSPRPKDGTGTQQPPKRGPLQTTSSSARKAASTVASPAAPPDQAPPQCSNCGVKKTPLWRRCGEQHELLCNACGLYWAMHKTHRPEKLKHSRSSGRHGAGGAEGGGGEGAGGLGGNTSEDDGPETLCSNCGTSTTPLWRKDPGGNTVCNACGLFMKLHGSARPVKMRADVIKKRVRYESVGGGASGGAGGSYVQHAAAGGSGAMAESLTGSGVGAGAGAGRDSMDLDLGLGSSGGEASNTGTSFAPFHPGMDTLGRLTTTAAVTGPASSSPAAGTPMSQGPNQEQTLPSFATQHHLQATSSHNQAQAQAQPHHHPHPGQPERSEDEADREQARQDQQDEWARAAAAAASFLLPHEPIGDGFHFGQALWGCDPGVIGNWHSGVGGVGLGSAGQAEAAGGAAGGSGGGGGVGLTATTNATMTTAAMVVSAPSLLRSPSSAGTGTATETGAGAGIDVDSPLLLS